MEDNAAKPASSFGEGTASDKHQGPDDGAKEQLQETTKSGAEEQNTEDANKIADAELEQEFVAGMVTRFLPMVEACDKQAYAVAASQDALLSRIQEVERLLHAFAEADSSIAPSLEERTEKLKDTRARLGRLNERLRLVQRRLLSVTTQLQAKS